MTKEAQDTTEFKYVVVVSDEKGEQMIIFPSNINHDDMAQAIQDIKVTYGYSENWAMLQPDLVSAGLTDLRTCYGRSETLNLDYRPDLDTMLLRAGGRSHS